MYENFKFGVNIATASVTGQGFGNEVPVMRDDIPSVEIEWLRCGGMI